MCPDAYFFFDFSQSALVFWQAKSHQTVPVFPLFEFNGGEDGKESFARPWDLCKKACRGWYVTHNRLHSLTWRRSLCWCCRWSGAPSWVLQNPRVSTLAFEKTRQQGRGLDGEMPAPPLSHCLPDRCFTAVNMSASTYRNLNLFTVSGLLSLLSLIAVWGIVKNC